MDDGKQETLTEIIVDGTAFMMTVAVPDCVGSWLLVALTVAVLGFAGAV
jgi:hypothetical protein